MAAQALEVDEFVAHMNIEQVAPLDTVIGTLPVHLAARVCAAGARYMHLSVDVPEQLRGRELNAAQLAALGASVDQYRVERIAPDAGGVDVASQTHLT